MERDPNHTSNNADTESAHIHANLLILWKSALQQQQWGQSDLVIDLDSPQCLTSEADLLYKTGKVVSQYLEIRTAFYSPATIIAAANVIESPPLHPLDEFEL